MCVFPMTFPYGNTIGSSCVSHSATILTIWAVTCPNHEVPSVRNISEIQYYPLQFNVQFFNNRPVKL